MVTLQEEERMAEDNSTDSDMLYDFIEKARGECKDVAPFKPLGSSKFSESRKGMQSGNMYPVVDDDPRIKRLLSALE